MSLDYGVTDNASIASQRARRTRALLAAAGALCLLAIAAPTAQAGLLVESAESCEAQDVDRAFLPWLDLAHYTLAPGGSMEDGLTGWSVSGASVVPGNEPFYVHGEDDESSLSLPPGSSAKTATICVGLEHPTMRLFARSSGSLTTSLTSSLRVDVLFETAGGHVASLPVGVVPAALHSKWRPTLPIPVIANLLPLLPGERTAVAFRFTPQGRAAWQIDDVYVDPFRRS